MPKTLKTAQEMRFFFTDFELDRVTSGIDRPHLDAYFKIKIEVKLYLELEL